MAAWLYLRRRCIIVKKHIDAPSDLFPDEMWVETGRQIDPPAPNGTFKMRLASGEVEEQRSIRPEWAQINPRKLR